MVSPLSPLRAAAAAAKAFFLLWALAVASPSLPRRYGGGGVVHAQQGGDDGGCDPGGVTMRIVRDGFDNGGGRAALMLYLVDGAVADVAATPALDVPVTVYVSDNDNDIDGDDASATVVLTPAPAALEEYGAMIEPSYYVALLMDRSDVTYSTSNSIYAEPAFDLQLGDSSSMLVTGKNDPQGGGGDPTGTGGTIEGDGTVDCSRAITVDVFYEDNNDEEDNDTMNSGGNNATRKAVLLLYLYDELLADAPATPAGTVAFDLDPASAADLPVTVLLTPRAEAVQAGTAMERPYYYVSLDVDASDVTYGGGADASPVFSLQAGDRTQFFVTDKRSDGDDTVSDTTTTTTNSDANDENNAVTVNVVHDGDGSGGAAVVYLYLYDAALADAPATLVGERTIQVPPSGEIVSVAFAPSPEILEEASNMVEPQYYIGLDSVASDVVYTQGNGEPVSDLALGDTATLDVTGGSGVTGADTSVTVEVVHDGNGNGGAAALYMYLYDTTLMDAPATLAYETSIQIAPDETVTVVMTPSQEALAQVPSLVDPKYYVGLDSVVSDVVYTQGDGEPIFNLTLGDTTVLDVTGGSGIATDGGDVNGTTPRGDADDEGEEEGEGSNGDAAAEDDWGDWGADRVSYDIRHDGNGEGGLARVGLYLYDGSAFDGADGPLPAAAVLADTDLTYIPKGGGTSFFGFRPGPWALNASLAMSEPLYYVSLEGYDGSGIAYGETSGPVLGLSLGDTAAIVATGGTGTDPEPAGDAVGVNLLHDGEGAGGRAALYLYLYDALLADAPAALADTAYVQVPGDGFTFVGMVPNPSALEESASMQDPKYYVVLDSADSDVTLTNSTGGPVLDLSLGDEIDLSVTGGDVPLGSGGPSTASPPVSAGGNDTDTDAGDSDSESSSGCKYNFIAAALCGLIVNSLLSLMTF